MVKGLYIHIPFCNQICSYCDFIKMVANQEQKERYVDALIKELYYYKNEYLDLKTVYIGGGTPSSLDLSTLDMFLTKIDEIINTNNLEEYTIETNPNDINNKFVSIIKKHHINRVSVGLQTINQLHLNSLNRKHTLEDVKFAIQELRHQNIFNINLDFIYGIPNQTIEDVIHDLDFIEKIKPTHISYYALILEPRTQLSYLVKQKKIQLLDDDLVTDMYEIIVERLKKFGYIHYETSNFALGNYFSKHNLIYWNLEEYLGIGLNSSSQYLNKRWKNIKYINKYIQNINSYNFNREEESFDPKVEYLLMGLRKIEGISIDDFAQRFKIDLFLEFKAIKKHLDNGLLLLENNRLRFSDKGIYLANQVFIDII